MFDRPRQLALFVEQVPPDKDLDRLLQAAKWLAFVLVTWFAGLPAIIHTLAILQVLDTVGGLLVASQADDPKDKINSRAFAHGWRRKAYCWILVMALYSMQGFFAKDFPIVIGNFTPAEVLAGAFGFTELISIVEKAIKLGVPIPNWLIVAMTDGRRRFTGEK